MSKGERVASAYVEIKADVDKLKKDLKKMQGTVKKEGNKAGRAFSKGMVKGFSVAGGITAIIALVKKAAQMAILQAQAQAKVTQAVKQTGQAAGFTAKQLFRMASELQKVTGVGDEEILPNVTNQLLTFTNITGDAFKRAQKAVLDLNAVIAGGGLASMSSQAIQLGKALEDPIRGVTALSRSGVTFTDVQKEQIKGFVKQNDLMSAQSIILTEIENKYGGQARALADAAGGTKQFSASLGDFLEKAGNLILPTLGFLIKDFTTLAQKVGVFDKDIKFVGTEDLIADMKNAGAAQKDIRAAQRVLFREMQTELRSLRNLYKGTTNELKTEADVLSMIKNIGGEITTSLKTEAKLRRQQVRANLDKRDVLQAEIEVQKNVRSGLKEQIGEYNRIKSIIERLKELQLEIKTGQAPIVAAVSTGDIGGKGRKELDDLMKEGLRLDKEAQDERVANALNADKTITENTIVETGKRTAIQQEAINITNDVVSSGLDAALADWAKFTTQSKNLAIKSAVAMANAVIAQLRRILAMKIAVALVDLFTFGGGSGLTAGVPPPGVFTNRSATVPTPTAAPQLSRIGNGIEALNENTIAGGNNNLAIQASFSGVLDGYNIKLSQDKVAQLDNRYQ